MQPAYALDLLEGFLVWWEPWTIEWRDYFIILVICSMSTKLWSRRLILSLVLLYHKSNSHSNSNFENLRELKEMSWLFTCYKILYIILFEFLTTKDCIRPLRMMKKFKIVPISRYLKWANLKIVSTSSWNTSILYIFLSWWINTNQSPHHAIRRNEHLGSASHSNSNSERNKRFLTRNSSVYIRRRIMNFCISW